MSAYECSVVVAQAVMNLANAFRNLGKRPEAIDLVTSLYWRRSRIGLYYASDTDCPGRIHGRVL